MSAKAPNEKIPFIKESDLEIYQKYRDAAFEVQVGLHELTGMIPMVPLTVPPMISSLTSSASSLPFPPSPFHSICSSCIAHLLICWLGHGCGKLLQETAPGTFNFDEKNPPISPLTNKPVTTWYTPGQTWGGVFGGLAGAYEARNPPLPWQDRTAS